MRVKLPKLLEMEGATSHIATNKNVLFFVLVVAGAVIVGILTRTLSVSINVVNLSGLLGLFGILAFLGYMAGIRFNSPTIVDSDGISYHAGSLETESVDDLGTSWLLIFHGGVNSGRHLFSFPDIYHGTARILLAPARICESMGSGRYVAVRGSFAPMSASEAALLLARPAFKAALSRRELNPHHVEVQVAYGARDGDLHTHAPIPPPVISEYRRILKDFLGELEAVERSVRSGMRSEMDIYSMLLPKHKEKEKRREDDDEKRRS